MSSAAVEIGALRVNKPRRQYVCYTISCDNSVNLLFYISRPKGYYNKYIPYHIHPKYYIQTPYHTCPKM